jgi:NAD(P)-dependent dehydrogenase (short-subunit alcohol dehydrogenase family)
MKGLKGKRALITGGTTGIGSKLTSVFAGGRTAFTVGSELLIDGGMSNI